MTKIIYLVLLNILMFNIIITQEESVAVLQNDNTIIQQNIIIKTQEEQVNLEEKYNINFIKKINDNLYLYEINTNNLEQDIIELNNDKTIEYAEIDQTMKTTSITEPEYSKIWAYNNSYYPDVNINIENIWGELDGAKDVIIGVIDSGIDLNHEDIKDNLWKNPGEICDDGIDNDSNGYIDDCYGYNFAENNNILTDTKIHGTPVSGVVASPVNNKGIVGVAPLAKIMTLKTISPDDYIYLSDVISAINYAKTFNVEIFNMSFVSSTFSNSLFETMENYPEALFVTAAGNESYNIDQTPMYPAAFDLPNVIAVSAVNYDGRIATFSNYGENTVEIAAPGVAVYTAVPGGYDYISGTSIAAPFITGQAALIKSQNTAYTPTEIKETIKNTAKKLATLNNKVLNNNFINVEASLSTDTINVETISTTKKYHLIKPGEKITLSPAITPTNATNKNLIYTTSDTSVATINSSGTITGVSDGFVTINIISEDNNASTTLPVIVDSSLNNTVIGDVDGDNQVTITDLIKLRKFLAGLEEW